MYPISTQTPELVESEPRPKRWPIGPRIRAGLRSDTLRGPWRELRKRAGGVLLWAAGRAVVIAAILYVLVQKGIGVPVEASAIYATLGLLGVFALQIVLGVGALELERDLLRRDFGVQARRIGAHLAVWEWVDQAERDDERRQKSPEYVLANLSGNVCNALQIPGAFFVPVHAERVRQIAEGPGDAADRLDELVDFLRRNLVAGVYLRG